MRAEKIGLRLNSKELEIVRNQPGATDNDRLRSIINGKAMGDTIADALDDRIDKLERKVNKIDREIDRIKERDEEIIQKLDAMQQKQDDIGKGTASIHNKVKANADEIGKAVNESYGANQELRAIRGKSSDAKDPPKKGLFG